MKTHVAINPMLPTVTPPNLGHTSQHKIQNRQEQSISQIQHIRSHPPKTQFREPEYKRVQEKIYRGGPRREKRAPPPTR
jgi:hypothetical protein